MMRPGTASPGREPSSDLDSSALSCTAAADPSRTLQTSTSITASSTPPTSHDDAASVKSEPMKSAKDLESEPSVRRVSSRARPLVATYNDKENAGTRIHTPTKYVNGTYKRKGDSRDPSATTPVSETPGSGTATDSATKLKARAADSHPKADANAQLESEHATIAQRRQTRPIDTPSGPSNTVVEASPRSAKRGRELTEAAKGSAQALGSIKKAGRHTREAARQPIDATDVAPKGSRLRESVALERPPLPRLWGTSLEPPEPPKKVWLDAGKFWGTGQATAPTKRANPNNMKAIYKNTPPFLFPLPMFTMAQVLDLDAKKKTAEAKRPFADFQLPFSVFSPLPRPVRLSKDEWNPLKRNEYRGEDALELRQKARKERKDLAKHDELKCQCLNSCDDQCYNRCTNTECNTLNCIIGPDCGNRAFADLAMRAKSNARTDMGRLFDVGVEVMETKDRGRGVRAMRAFERDQVIMEYIGEIITQTESDRRVKNDYKDHRCFYLMTFHQKLIIDGYRGNVARFVNHSCEPNCRMEKWMVNGDLRMALFANRMIMTGEELTWNYSFESYGKEQECLCGARTCRGAIGRGPGKGLQKEKDTDGPVVGTKRAFQDDSEKKPPTKRQKVSDLVSTVSKKSMVVAAKAKAGMKGLITKAAAIEPPSTPQETSRAERASRRISSTPERVEPAASSRVGRLKSIYRTRSSLIEVETLSDDAPEDEQPFKRSTRSSAQVPATVDSVELTAETQSRSVESSAAMSLRRSSRRNTHGTDVVTLEDSPSDEHAATPASATTEATSTRRKHGTSESISRGSTPKKIPSLKRPIDNDDDPRLEEGERGKKQTTLNFDLRGLSFARSQQEAESLKAERTTPMRRRRFEKSART